MTPEQFKQWFAIQERQAIANQMRIKQGGLGQHPNVIQ